jgi:tRNA U34 2-thiouridine synthase MnmA/TrmU
MGLAKLKIIGIGLLSGGLDSILAVKVMQEQGIEVIGVVFETPFFSAERAIKAANDLGIKLITKDITRPYLIMLKRPRYGYGGNMNPCIDCHAMMIREAGRIMEEEEYHFIFTGEVLNERPMSQTRKSLKLVAQLSGYQDYLLRPLSAKLLPETKAEKFGLVDRKRLLNIQGRSRKLQLQLAKKYGIKEFPTPGGGCLLTDPNFSKKLKELFDTTKEPSLRDIELLKIGRHFRIQGKKVIVGRNQEENQKLKAMATENDIVLSAEHVPGPITLICDGGSKRVIKKAAGICAWYSDARQEGKIPLIYQLGEGGEEIIPEGISQEKIDALRI